MVYECVRLCEHIVPYLVYQGDRGSMVGTTVRSSHPCTIVSRIHEQGSMNVFLCLCFNL